MKSVLNSFYTISKNVRQFISSKNNICVSRKRINDVFDGILYKLFYSNANTTQEDAVIKVNSFKTHETCSRQALVKKEDLIPVQVYVELSILLNSNIHDILYKNITQNNNLIIIAVDGTYSTMKESLCNDGYKSNKNGESVTALITGMFNVTCNCPIGLHITTNARCAYVIFIKTRRVLIKTKHKNPASQREKHLWILLQNILLTNILSLYLIEGTCLRFDA